MATEKWDCVILREICDLINYGYTASATPEPIGPKFLRITDVVPDRINWSTVPHCKIDERKLSKYRLEEGDIVIARTGATTGYAKRIRENREAVFASYLVRLRVIANYDSQYVGFVIESEDYKHFIQQNIGGTAQPQANAQVLTSFPIPLPPLATQRKIAAILSNYDDLIENNTRRIEILEEMAGTIYREWFVEFRFPGHENAKVVESELGLIPQGWEIKRLSDIVSEIIDYRGKTPRKLGSNWSESGIMALSAMNVKQGRLVRLEKAKFVSEELYKRWMKSEVAENDILMTSEAPLGEVYYLTEKKKICLSQRLYCIRANPNFIKSCVLFFALMAPSSKMQLHARATGTTVSGIRQAALREILFAIPPLDLQSRAEMVLETLLKTKETLENTNINLRKTRDLLLPKLISGELDVADLDIGTDLYRSQEGEKSYAA